MKKQLSMSRSTTDLMVQLYDIFRHAYDMGYKGLSQIKANLLRDPFDPPPCGLQHKNLSTILDQINILQNNIQNNEIVCPVTFDSINIGDSVLSIILDRSSQKNLFRINKESILLVKIELDNEGDMLDQLQKYIMSMSKTYVYDPKNLEYDELKARHSMIKIIDEKTDRIFKADILYCDVPVKHIATFWQHKKFSNKLIITTLLFSAFIMLSTYSQTNPKQFNALTAISVISLLSNNNWKPKINFLDKLDNEIEFRPGLRHIKAGKQWMRHMTTSMQYYTIGIALREFLPKNIFVFPFLSMGIFFLSEALQRINENDPVTQIRQRDKFFDGT